MATVKISALVALAAASITATDVLPIVDDIGGVPVTKKASIADMRTALLGASGAGWTATDYLGLGAGTIPSSGMVRSGQGAITADAPLINSTATWNNVAITFRHLLVNVTDTASAAASLFADFQIAGVSKWSLTKAGAVTQASSLTVSAGGVTVSAGTTTVQALSATSGVFSLTVACAALTTTAQQALTLQNNGNNDVWLNAASANFRVLNNGGAAQLFAITQAGVGTIAGGLTITAGGLTATGNSTITGTLGGVTTLTCTTVTATNLGGTLSTAAQPNITSVGVLASPHMTSAVVDSGGFTITAGGANIAGLLVINAATFAARTGTQAVIGWENATTPTGSLRQQLGDAAGYFDWVNAVHGATLMTLTNGGALTVANGATVTAGGLTVSAGTTAVQGFSAVGGVTLTASVSGVTSASPDATQTARILANNAGVFIGASSASDLNLQSGGVSVWKITTVGHLLAVTDASYDIGASGATRPRNIYTSGAVTVGNALTVTAGGATITAGNLGVGGAQQTNVGAYILSTALATTSQVGVYSNITGTSGATTSIYGVQAVVQSAAAAYTATGVAGLYVSSIIKGAGSTITTAYGLYVESQTVGGTNYAIYTNTGPVSLGDALTVRSGNVTVSSSNAASDVMVKAENTDAGATSRGTVQWKTGISATIWQAFARNGAFWIGRAGTADDLTINGSGQATFSNALTVTVGGITVTGNSTITGTLGGITTLTATTFSGALSGNATTATTLQTARLINGVSFNGSADITISAVAAAGTLTGTTLAANVVTSSLTALGTIATGVWQGTAIANAYIASGLDVAKITVGTTLPSNVVTSSLTSVGTLGALAVAGTTTLSGLLQCMTGGAGGAPINLPHVGAPPTTPVNGDIWTTAAGMFVRISGVTKTVTLT